LQLTPNYVQNEMAGSAVHVSTNRLAEDPNQNKELAREHVGSEAAAIWNPHLLLAGLFRWNIAIALGEREMQELLFSGNTSNTSPGAS